MPIDRLKIVVVCDFAHVNGGGAQVALTSACELARRGLRFSYSQLLGRSIRALAMPAFK